MNMKKYGMLVLAIAVALVASSVDHSEHSYAQIPTATPTATPIPSPTLRSTPASSLTPKAAAPRPTFPTLSATQWAGTATPRPSTATVFPDW